VASVSFPSTVVSASTDLAPAIDSSIEEVRREPPALGASDTPAPGSGTGCKWWCKSLSNCLSHESTPDQTRSTTPTITTALLPSTDLMTMRAQADGSRFFSEHFKSPAFNEPGADGKLDHAAFESQKTELFSQLPACVKGKSRLRVPLHDLPECHAKSLSPRLNIREDKRYPVLNADGSIKKIDGKPVVETKQVWRTHVSVALLESLLKNLLEALREDRGTKRTVHLDLGRRPLTEEQSASPSASSSRSQEGFLALPFKDVIRSMKHFGTQAPVAGNAGISNIPGLTVSADLSGLKIEYPDLLDELSNGLILRSTIASLHLDVSLFAPNLRTDAWHRLETMIGDTTPRPSPLSMPALRGEIIFDHASRHLRHLTLTLPENVPASSYAGYFASGLIAKGCRLESLTLVGGNWTDEAKALLLDAVKTRRSMWRPVAVTVEGQELEPPVEWSVAALVSWMRRRQAAAAGAASDTQLDRRRTY
jgi:hypothetical protein